MNTKQSEKASLARALVAAQRDLKGVVKGSENKFQHYKYASADDMMSACRAALHAHGLAARRSRWTIEADETHHWCVASYELIHESGEMESFVMATRWPFSEEKGRTLDKSLASALTSSLAYWLRDLLLVPRDDEEMDQRDTRDHDPEVLGISRAGKLRAQCTKNGTTIEALRDRLRQTGLQLPDDPVQWPAAAATAIAAALKMSA